MASPARAAAEGRSARKTTGSGTAAGRIHAKRHGSSTEWAEKLLASAGRKAVRCGWVLALAGVAAAQSEIYLSTQARNVDFSAAGFTKPIKTGSALPGSCSVGELFFETTAPAGANLFACTSANTWSVQAGNGAGGSVGVAANGVLTGVRPTINVISGTGIQSVLADTGSQINVQLQIDSSVVQSKGDEQGGGTVLCASSSGSSSTYTCALTPAASGYVKGMVLHWIPDLAGAGGATTLNVNTLGAVPVKMGDGVTDPSVGDVQAGQMYVLWYDGSAFRMVTSASAVSGGGTGGGSTAWGNLTGVPSTFNAGQILGAAIPPLGAGHLQYNGSGLAWDPAVYLTGNQNITVSGDCSGSGATSISMTCGKTNGTAFAASATTDTTNASNITSGTLPHARLPALLSSDIPNNAANTTGSAGSLSAASALPAGTTATTQPQGDGSTKLATTQYVDTGLAGKQAAGSYAGVGNCPAGQYATGTAAGSTQPCSPVQYSQVGGTPSSLPPSGAAGGGLAGSYPSPSVAQVSESVTPLTAASSPYTVLGSDSVLTCDASGGAVTVNLPAASGTHREISLKKLDASANACILARNGTDTIDGATLVSITVQYAVAKIQDAASGKWYRMHVNQVGGDVSGPSTSETVTGINGGVVPSSAASIGTNSSGQPVAFPVEVLRGSICMAAGCASESSMNGIMMNGSGTITACGFNLLTAPSGSSVTVAIQQNGTTAASLTLAVSANKVKATGLSIAFADQDIFTWKITANDSGNSAQGGTVQCWR